MKKKNVTLLLIYISLLILLVSSCYEKSEVPELIVNNPFENNSGVDFFVMDSMKVTPDPYIKLFYHVRYDLMKDSGRITKILLFENGHLRYRFSVTSPIAYCPTEYYCNSGNTYTFRLALVGDQNDTTKLSMPHSIYVPW